MLQATEPGLRSLSSSFWQAGMRSKDASSRRSGITDAPRNGFRPTLGRDGLLRIAIRAPIPVGPGGGIRRGNRAEKRRLIPAHPKTTRSPANPRQTTHLAEPRPPQLESKIGKELPTVNRFPPLRSSGPRGAEPGPFETPSPRSEAPRGSVLQNGARGRVGCWRPARVPSHPRIGPEPRPA